MSTLILREGSGQPTQHPLQRDLYSLVVINGNKTFHLSCNIGYKTFPWYLMEKGVAIHSSILAWRIPRTEEPGRIQSMGSQTVGHDWVTNTFDISCELRTLKFTEFLSLINKIHGTLFLVFYILSLCMMMFLGILCECTNFISAINEEIREVVL